MNTLDQIVKSMKKGKRGEYDCSIGIEIEGVTWKAYSVSIAENDLLFYCEMGMVTILVDWYGDTYKTEVFDWNID